MRFAADGLPFGPSMRMRLLAESGAPFEGLKSDGCVHVVAKHGLSGFEIAAKDAFDGVAQRACRNRFALRPRSEWFP